MSNLTACIYCQELKAVTDFNREHVIPASFGTFGSDTFVLHRTVCRDCNQLLGDTIDRDLARDSPEGLERYSVGVGRLKEVARIGRSRLQVRHVGGFLDGAIAEFAPTADGSELVTELVPQFGFSKERNGPVQWMRANPMPTKEELASAGFSFPGELFVRTAGMPPDEAETALRQIGFDVAAPEVVSPESMHGTVDLTIRAKFDESHRRGIAKIAFNYLALRFPVIASMPQFDGIRRYIRFAEQTHVEHVTASDRNPLGQIDPQKQILAHLVTMHWDVGKHALLAQVSLFTWATYVVQLSTAPFPALPPLCVDCGHLFDPFNQRILEVSRHVPSGTRLSLPMIERKRLR